MRWMETRRLTCGCTVCICCTEGGDEAADEDHGHGLCIEAVPDPGECDCTRGVPVQADCDGGAAGGDHQGIDGVPVANSTEACREVSVACLGLSCGPVTDEHVMSTLQTT